MIENEYVNRAIAYILNNIGENISVDDVAKHCNFSKYHFSRMFKSSTGESIYEFIKRTKMEQSAFCLKVKRHRSITEIGEDYGYSSSNYSTTFKQHYEKSPIEFRRSILQKSMVNPVFGGNFNLPESFEEYQKNISIEYLEDFQVIYERKIGNYGDLYLDWEAFQDKYQEYITEETIFLERDYNDPSITNVNECLYDICMTAPKNYPLKNVDTIKGGKFAVYHFNGFVKDIYKSYQGIFSVWLPKSGYEVDSNYGFEIYRKVDCVSMYMEVEFCIPIKITTIK